MIVVRAPVAGAVVGLEAVPDPVFSEGLVGPGLAIEPVREPGRAVAPIAGMIAKLHPHAFVVVGDGGRGVLIHLGVDTVRLGGEGFEPLASQGDRVEAGRPVIAWNPAAVVAGGRSPVCAVVALDASEEAVVALARGAVRAGDELFRWM